MRFLVLILLVRCRERVRHYIFRLSADTYSRSFRDLVSIPLEDDGCIGRICLSAVSVKHHHLTTMNLVGRGSNPISFHHQKLPLIKVSNDHSTSASYGNPPLSLILKYHHQKSMVGNWKVIYMLPPAPETILQLVKCGCNRTACDTG